MRDRSPGTQEFWASRNPTRSFGWNSNTPPMTIAIIACCISIQWLAAGRENRVLPYRPIMPEGRAVTPPQDPQGLAGSSGQRGVGDPEVGAERAAVAGGWPRGA